MNCHSVGFSNESLLHNMMTNSFNELAVCSFLIFLGLLVQLYMDDNNYSILVQGRISTTPFFFNSNARS